METGNLQILLMDNWEIMFNWRSLGYISKEEIDKYYTSLQK